jgi:hypothetical protein
MLIELGVVQIAKTCNVSLLLEALFTAAPQPSSWMSSASAAESNGTEALTFCCVPDEEAFTPPPTTDWPAGQATSAESCELAGLLTPVR